MQTAYRDGVSQLRRRAEANAAQVLKRGAALSAKVRRELPRKLRRELKGLERQLGGAVENLDDVALLERRTEEYRLALSAAETISALVPQYIARRRRRLFRRVLLVVLAAGPLVAVMVAMVVVEKVWALW